MKRVTLVDETCLEREGLRPEPERREDGRRTKDDDGAFEWWYFDAQLTDGSTVVAVFAAQDPLARGADPTPTVRIVLTPPGSTRPLERYDVFSGRDFLAATDHCQVTIGPNAITSDATDEVFTVRADLQGLALDLTFTRRLPAWRPGASKVCFDFGPGQEPGYFAWLVALPLADVHGTLTYQG